MTRVDYDKYEEQIKFVKDWIESSTLDEEKFSYVLSEYQWEGFTLELQVNYDWVWFKIPVFCSRRSFSPIDIREDDYWMNAGEWFDFPQYFLDCVHAHIKAHNTMTTELREDFDAVMGEVKGEIY